MSSWTGMSVLIVDDNKTIRNQLRQLYSSQGLDVVGEAANGVEALKQYEELKPRFVSLDIIMPEMHGVDCFRRLCIHGDSVGCFFVTAVVPESVLENSDDEPLLPIDRFLPKIPSEAQLHTVLNLILNTPDDETVEIVNDVADDDFPIQEENI